MKPLTKKAQHKNTWGEAMLKNSEYLAWGKKKYKKNFVIPYDIDEYRKKKGLKSRPRKFKVF